MQTDEQLCLLRELADAVARVVKAAPFEGLGAELRIGADGTPTKHVDDVAERAILAELRDGGHKVNVLSEEAGFVDLGGDMLLVTDPIDGTTNAIRGIPFYCVSLALGSKTMGDVQSGIVVNLATGDRYEAVVGQGATLNGRPLRVRPESAARIVSVASATAPLPKGVGAVRCFGASALELCLVAQGAIDAFHYTKPILRTIDVAAGALLVREAGGVVLDLNGAEFEVPLTLEPRFGMTAASSLPLARRIQGGES